MQAALIFYWNQRENIVFLNDGKQGLVLYKFVQVTWYNISVTIGRDSDVFTRLNYMERRGSGFKKIIEDYQNQYKYTEAMAPIFRSEPGSFYLKLKNLNYVTPEKAQDKGEIKGEINSVLTEKEIMGVFHGAILPMIWTTGGGGSGHFGGERNGRFLEQIR